MPQTSWILSPQAHAVVHDGDLVVLDVTSDSYLCLPDADPAICLEVDTRGIEIFEPEIARALVAAGLVSRAPAAGGPGASPADRRSTVPTVGRLRPPVASAVKLTYPRPGWGDLATGLAGVQDLLHGYWRQPFAETLRRGVAGRPPVAATPSSELLAAVDAFHRWSPYAPAPAKCLVRAFLLLRWLARRGHGVHWVFGVTTWPFRAHCWLQCGEVALDDDVERLAAYSIIMVV
jgi:hypothetical protein